MNAGDKAHHFDPTSLPASARNNFWYRNSDSDTALVFVHGVLSDSRSCWLSTHESNQAYWPQLVADDSRFDQLGIYLGGYYTAVDAGRYELRNAADELLAALKRSDIAGDAVLSKKRIIFVCHSTGGLVVRYILVNNYHLFAAKSVGLMLIASPSYGSVWGNRLRWLTSLYGHRVGQQLSSGHWSVRELDAQFKTLVNERRIPRLVGVEAYENHFIIHRKWLPEKQVLVTEESAGRYFGAPILLRDTNHFSSVKPTSWEHPSHQLLVDFYQQHFRFYRQHFREADQRARFNDSEVVSFVFERNPSYPVLKFSIVNNADKRVQVSGLRVLKVASEKDEHELMKNLMGPRMKLDFSLSSATDGVRVDVFQDRVSHLQPGESEAFSLALDSKNLVSMIDLEAECIIAGARTTQISRPKDVVLVHSPAPGETGAIAVLDREELLSNILSGTVASPWRDASYAGCKTHRFVLIRGAAALGFHNPDAAWEQLRRKFEGTDSLGTVLASFADALNQDFVPQSVKSYLAEWISDPSKIRESPITDIETPALVISRALRAAKMSDTDGSNLAPRQRYTYEATQLEKTLEVWTAIDKPGDDDPDGDLSEKAMRRLLGMTSLNSVRLDLLRNIVAEFNAGAVEFLIATLVVQPQMYYPLNEILGEVTKMSDRKDATQWWTWWQQNRKHEFTSFEWRQSSPRLAKAFDAYQATEDDLLGRFVLDPDEIVRFAAAQNPKLTQDHLEVLARDPRPMIRSDVAKNPATPERLLRVLARDSNSIVRRWVSRNPNASEDTIRELKNDKVADVRKFVQGKR